MPAARDPQDLVRVARLYYQDGRSQQEIAQELGTSRSNVSRMLTHAVETGIVEIRIHDPAGRDADLEQRLRSRFGLADARVASSAGTDALSAVGTQAAGLLLHSIGEGTTVGLSWGSALQAMVFACAPDHPYAAQLVQLVGGLPSVAHEISGQELVRELAGRLGTTAYRYLHAPAVLTSREARDSLLGEAPVAATLDLARRADVAFVGVGTPTHGSSKAVLDSLHLTAREVRAFWGRHPVGDVAARYFDAEGLPLDGPVDDRVMAVTVDDLRKIPTVVGVAAGRVKAPAVLGALRGRLVDVLVCDDALARAVLTADDGDPDGGDPGGDPGGNPGGGRAG